MTSLALMYVYYIVYDNATSLTAYVIVYTKTCDDVTRAYAHPILPFFCDVTSLPCGACISLLVVHMSCSQMAQYVYGKMSSQMRVIS